MLITIETLKQLFTNYQGLSRSEEILQMMYDSRKDIPKSLFVPIVGDNHDAHEYIEQAIEKGAIASFWNENHEIPNHLLDRCQFFIVKDTVEALQTLATYYRNEVNPQVIGITGSNGKTTTKDLVSAVLSTKYRVHKTEGNYNNHIGLPMTILNMPINTDILVVEMGMNDFGEIDLLTNIAKPDYAMITNIGESHIEYLGTRAGIAQAKLEIINGLDRNTGVLYVDGDEPLLDDITYEGTIVRCSFQDETSDYFIRNIEMTRDETKFSVKQQTYKIPLLGAHHAKNATFAIMIAEKLDVSTEMIQQGFDQLEYSKMRFQMVEGKNGVTIVNDAYNASPTSMKAAIEVLKHMKQFQTKVIVLGDVLELGDRAAEFHKDIAQSIEKPIDAVFTLGNYAEIISNVVKKQHETIESKHFTNKEEVVQSLQRYLNKDSIILFKASRGMAFENMIERLLHK